MFSLDRAARTDSIIGTAQRVANRRAKRAGPARRILPLAGRFGSTRYRGRKTCLAIRARILDDLVTYARQFRDHDEWIADPLNRLGQNMAVFEMEKRLSGAASGFLQTFNEYKARVAELPHNPFSLPLRRAIDAIPGLIESRLRQWGWDLSILTPEGSRTPVRRCKADEEARTRALEEAAVSWRTPGKDLKPNRRADDLAFGAEQRGIKPMPTMPPEDAERAYHQRNEEYCMKLMIGQVIPQVTPDEHDQLCRAVTELAMLASREWSPTPFFQGNPYSQSAKDVARSDQSQVCGRLELYRRHMEARRSQHARLWGLDRSELGRIRAAPANLLQFAIRMRPDLDASPLAELVDVPTHDIGPAPELFVKFLRSVEILQAAVETLRLKESAPGTADNGPRTQQDESRRDEASRSTAPCRTPIDESPLSPKTSNAFSLLPSCSPRSIRILGKPPKRS